MAKAGIRIGFQVYMGLLFFTSIVAGAATFAISIPFLMLFNVEGSLELAVLTGVLASVFSMVICYVYPKAVGSSRGSKIDASLPIIANFMSVLASSGITPEAIFHSLARVGAEFNVDREAKDVIRDVAFMGLDLHTALKKASERSPSRKFAALIDGFVTTSNMGGDLAAYLRLEADKYKRARMLKMRRFLDNLGVIAEAYIAFMVAAPLMLIVMISVMAFIGGGITIANLDPKVLLDILTFVVLPAGVAIMIFLVDFMTPMR